MLRALQEGAEKVTKKDEIFRNRIGTGRKAAVNSLESQIYRFEDIEVDVLRGRIVCGGEDRHLRQQAFSILVYLIRKPGSIISKNELMDEIWKDTAVVDDVLVQCIKDIRRALGDDPHRPRYIRTIPKTGYCFIGQIIEDSNGWVKTDFEEFTRSELEISHSVRHPPTGEHQDVELLLLKKYFRALSPGRFLLAAALIILPVIALLGYFGPGLFKSPSGEILLPSVPGKKSVAVMYFVNQTGEAELDWLREGLPDMLIADLSRSDKLSILSRSRLHLLIERVKDRNAAELNPGEETEIARKVRADVYVTGSFARLGEKIRIDVQIQDTQTGQILGAEGLTVEKAENILNDLDLLSLKLLARLGAESNEQTDNPGLAFTMTDNLEAYRYYSLAVEKAQGLHNKEAIELLEKAVALDPKFAMAHARIGYVYALSWGFAEKARPHLEKAFRLSERLTEKDRLFIAAWYAIANLDYPAAIPPLREIISKYPLETEAYGRLGAILHGEGQEDDALAVLKLGLAVDSEDKTLYNALGGLLSVQGKHEEAVAMRSRYVALAPNEPNAFDSLGLVYQHSGHYEEAIAQYHRALELNPQFEVGLAHLANTRFRQGRYRETIELYKKYVEAAPSELERARGLGRLSIIYLRLRNFAEAEKAARLSLQYNVEEPAALVLALERGDRAGIQKLERQILAQTRWSGRGMKLLLRRDLYLHGLLALEKGQTEAALGNFRGALRQLPLTWDLEDYEDCLANAYLKIGSYDEAITEYERILRLNPNYPLARFHLAQAYEKKGLKKEALQSYLLFLQNWPNADRDIPEIITAEKFVNQSKKDYFHLS